MNTAFYTASSGVLFMQKSLDVTANNIANVETPGFKTSVSSFADLLYTNIHRDAVETANNLKVGHGARLSGATKIMSQGPMQPTDRDLDYAIVGEGFFAVENQNGERFYTRAGNFCAKLDGEMAYLTTSNGEYVLSPDGERIELTAEGKTGLNLKDMKTRIGVFQFANKYAMEQVGNNLYRATSAAGEPQAGENYDLLQGSLEGSNAELSKEMVDVITTQRAFQFNARVVQAADELEATVNNLR
ncbi:flagellar hook-basal body protein [Acetanaerobacterium elongatum]|uniref:Flagellar basal-body rod protein FlgG n=1 Tax=Acetanaerobacterium elongatum TaxID=258515 RepID=A0A1G9ZF10_9FIRM|nr:flagellar hook-basal body protein [Acetanaerobacterium elongatum]SDN19571.1 flagellar basal-body rod protein FlgG [Acetanaerobacterium elongatum]